MLAMKNVRSRVNLIATLVTWMFILGSLGSLLYLGETRVSGSTSYILSAKVDDGTLYDGFGLTYRGTPGTFLLWGQFAIVAASGVLSTLRLKRARRIGHIALIAWSALWTANYLWIGMNVPMLWIWATGVMHVFILLCVMTRAGMGWTPKPKGPAGGKTEEVANASLSGGVAETE